MLFYYLKVFQIYYDIYNPSPICIPISSSTTLHPTERYENSSLKAFDTHLDSSNKDRVHVNRANVTTPALSRYLPTCNGTLGTKMVGGGAWVDGPATWK